MTVKHLVITGGGPYGIITFGIYEKLFEEKFIERDNIETIHSTSAIYVSSPESIFNSGVA